jgi:hypothetical protein
LTIFLKKSSPETAISITLHAKHPWVKGIQKFSNKRPGPPQREDN